MQLGQIARPLVSLDYQEVLSIIKQFIVCLFFFAKFVIDDSNHSNTGSAFFFLSIYI